MVITIDGPAASGKSTAARQLAGRLEIAYLDTGAMYRAAALKCLREGVELDDEQSVMRTVASADIEVDCGPTHTRVLLDGHDVSEAVRGMEVNQATPLVSRNPEVRRMMVDSQRAIGRHMVLVAVITALVMFAFGGLLMRLLHITGGAVAVAGGIILATLAIEMVHGPGKKVVEEAAPSDDPTRIAVYPLAVPYLLNPVGITVLIIASAEVVSVASVALVVGLVLLVGAFDYAIFANIDKVAKRLRPTSLVISEVVFGILLTAVAVQLVVTGLNLLGIISTPGAEH